ncbi:MAG: fibrobacter succinogenes major paralogous domain-containing protein [Flavobacterium sp.]|uniref:fibrobacter succinogenes major paralogous domain-containing protein n=1 Tax=Flavobacterium sp. TaxID=239 RepID=UPI003BCB7178
MKYKYIFVFMFLSCLSTAQKVSNITFRQEQSTIIISYDLETKTSCKISLFVSTDDGKTWQGPLKKVSGDAGAKIASGNHSITWNVLEEFEELRGDKIKFQVRADVGNIETVIIGTQEWKVKNLDVSRYRNGDIIPEVKDPEEWASLSTGAWCYYNNDPENGNVYGKLYNWYAVNDSRGLAPEGFHIPSDEEWTKLINYLGGEEIAGGKLKSTGTSLWFSPNTNATNYCGFSGLPAGYRTGNGIFKNVGMIGFWWLSSGRDTSKAYSRGLGNDVDKAYSLSANKYYGFSVRCLRD